MTSEDNIGSIAAAVEYSHDYLVKIALWQNGIRHESSKEADVSQRNCLLRKIFHSLTFFNRC